MPDKLDAQARSSWIATGRCLKKSDTCIMPVSSGYFPWTGEAIRKINASGMKSVLITNQSGIERGYFPESTVHAVHEVLQQELKQCEGTSRCDLFLPPCARNETATAANPNRA